MFNQVKSPQFQYGYSQNQDYGCLVSVLSEKIDIEWLPQPSQPERQLPKQSILTYAVPHSMIWRKIYFFPLTLNTEQIYTQVITLLQQALPVALQDLQFDYQIQPLDQAYRVAVFALHKQFAQERQLSAGTRLDCELHCLARAIHYLAALPLNTEHEYAYPFGDQFVCFQREACRIQPKLPENLPLMMFEQPQLPPNIIDRHLYLTALGAALWNGTGSI